MKKRAGFAGATNGTIENIVDTHTDQTVAGSKTFTHTITSSADTMLSGAGDVSASFYHGDGRHLVNITASHVSLSNGPTGSIQFHNTGGQISGSGNFRFLTASNTVEVDGDISASGNISASFFYGDGRYLTNITASSISGQLSASQIAHDSPLTNSAGVLDVKIVSQGGIIDSSGLKLGIDSMNVAPYNDAYFIAASDGSNNPYKIQFSTLESNMNIDAGNLVGTIDNNRLPANISVTSISASSFISSSTYYGDGSNLTGITASAGGSAAAQGPIGSLQFHTGSGGISGSANILFLTSSNTLLIDGGVSASLGELEEIRVTDFTFLGSGFNYPVETVLAQANGTTLIVTGGVDFRNDLDVAGEITTTILSASTSITSSLGELGEIRSTGLTFLGSGFNYPVETVLAQANGTTLIVTGGVDFRNDLDVSGETTVTTLTASTYVSASTYYGDGSNLTNLSVSTFTRTEITSSTYTVLTSDYYVGVNFTGSGGSTLTLPSAATMNSGQTIIIKDESGQASSHNILINVAAGEFIDGQTSQSIISDYGSISLYSDGGNNYFIF
jgi:hypothetical protein